MSDIERRKKTEQVMRDFSNLVNDYNFEVEPFIKEFANKHRTLQQKMFGVFLSLLVHTASDDYYTDARNEDAKRKAKMLLEGYGEMLKQEYLETRVNPESAEAQKEAEEHKQYFLRKPMDYLKTPLI